LLIPALLAGCAAAPPRELPAYREVVDPAESARPTAERILKHLSTGDIDAAAALSNAPERRAQVLREYRDSVGEVEFRRIFTQYASRPVAREIAVGKRRVVMWDLDGPLGAQYFVRAGERFVLDDVPSEERSDLRRLLNSFRQEARRRPDNYGPGPEFSSAGKD
jgi:hypothetical protein